MDERPPRALLNDLLSSAHVEWNLSPEELERHCLELDDCRLTDSGAVVAYSGRYTGRIPKDKFIVRDDLSEDLIWWDGNSPISPEHAQRIKEDVFSYLGARRLYVVDTLAGADEGFQIKVRFVVERAYHALFVSQLFIAPSPEQLKDFQPDWVVADACRLYLNPTEHGTRSDAAIVLDFSHRDVVIAGTEYAGELKKSIFTVMNYLLPQQNVLSMHCSANKGEHGDVALFFGLSGTGKTSLSADPNRRLIGDDEHGWSDDGVFNVEGGCYAKCIDLTREKEPEIWDAIKSGSVLENVVLNEAGVPDYRDQSITENTRAAYPLNFIPNAVIPSVGSSPAKIMFLTCDALGLLPPISRLTPNQVLFYFLNGYTAKVAGTELGVTEPTLTFSTCFGQPFLPLKPHVYGKLLLEKIAGHGAQVWLINTGWTGGPFGVGHRISIQHTRRMLDAVLAGELEQVPYSIHPIFDLQFPTSCPNVPAELLDPRGTWEDVLRYDDAAADLQRKFEQNAAKFGLTRS